MKRAVGLLGWLGVVLVLAAVALRFIRPEMYEWTQRLAMAGLVVVGLYALSQWRDVARSFQGRNVRYGSLAAGSVVLLLAILVGINWIANRQNKRWDLTEAGQFSLSDQTRQILRSLEQPIAIKAFYRSGDGSEIQLRDRLEQYAYESSQVSVEYIDPDRDPTTAKRYEIQQYGTVVFEYGGRIERTTTSDEQSLTNALKKAVEGQAKKVYFVQGHGERDPESSEIEGYSGIADGLKSDNFEIATVTLIQQEGARVPDDATMLVVAGPRTDLLEPELQSIRDYLNRQGKVMLLLDPPDEADAPQPTGLVALAREYGIDVGTNVAVDVSGVGQLFGTNELSPVGAPAPHPITERFGLMTAFPLARSVAPVEGGVEGRFAQKVVETSPQSWAESDLKRLFATGETERNLDAGDIAGPVSIAAAVSVAAPAPEPAPEPTEAPAPRAEARLLVVGDSDFASNRALGFQGNRDLYLNMANWLAQQENLIAIRPKDPSNRGITLTADQQARISWIAFLGIPVLLIGNAVRVWWKRR